jgi:H+/Cl- antiporter ClcA
MTTPDTAPASTRRPIAAMTLSAVVGLAVGYVVLLLVNAGIELMWTTIPTSLGEAPAWYVLAVPIVAGFLVYVIRRFLGDHGHSPLGGITITALSPRAYLDVILAIGATLFGGLVLGPEVALVATGSVTGGLLAKWMRVADGKRVVVAGAAGAILALFVRPLLTGSNTLSGSTSQFEVATLGWAVVLGALVAVIVAVVRWVAWWIARATGGAPTLWALVGSAIVVAASALLLNAWTGAPVTFIVTSGEGFISDLAEETAVSTVVAVVLLKALAYAVSLGSGFRGGPFFPVMFLGAAVGLLVALVAPSGPSAAAAIVVGIVAAVIATAAMSWSVALILGALIGFAFGGWALVPAAVVGAAAGRLVPRFGDRGADQPVESAPAS